MFFNLPWPTNMMVVGKINNISKMNRPRKFAMVVIR